jgi:hypothetical protein
MLKKIQNWMANPKREYAEGLKFFNDLANKEQKASFGKFLNDVDQKEIAQFDPAGRFSILINQVRFIERRIKASPDQLKLAQNAKVKSINTETPSGDSGKGKDDTAPTGSESKITDLSQLPEEFAPDVARLKEIVPLMAKIHADMANELADDVRANLRTQLVDLDDERRAIWDRINKFMAEGEKESIEKSESEQAVEKNMFEFGKAVAEDISKLKGYVTRNTNLVKKYTEEGKADKAADAQQRVDEYAKQLAELEALFSKE